MPSLVTAAPSIKIDGAPPPSGLDLSVLRVQRSAGAAAHAHLRFDDSEQAATVFTVGKLLEVIVNDDTGEPASLFSGPVVSVGLDWERGRNELSVDAFDKSYKLAQRSVVASHGNKTAKAIITEAVQSVGMTADIANELGTTTYPHVQQWGTLHEFIGELCRTSGCEWWVEGSKLIVKRRSAAGAAVVTLNGDADLHWFTARFSSVDQASKITVRGWDQKKKVAVVGEANGINGAAPSSAPIVTTVVDSDQKADSWPRRIIGPEDASTIAAGIAQRLGASVLSARGECDVDARIKPGCVVKIDKVSTKWNGSYYITNVEHLFGRDQPFVTRFSAGVSEDGSLVDLLGSRHGPSSAQFTAGLTIGIVTNNNDAEGKQNRVKLKLPYLSDQDETDWARVVQPGAGAGRGMLNLPEVDDEVLVGFEHGDIRRPYVLGGLWNGKDAPPLGNDKADLFASGKVISRSWTSRKGHVISLVDATDAKEDRIDLKVSGGTVLELSLGASGVRLEHKKDEPIKVFTPAASFEIAKGGDITIKGKSITLEATSDITLKANGNVKTQGLNVETTANTALKLKGTASVAIEASGITEVKGAMVKIN